ncbi:MAG: hypothetical protein E6J91_40370 [Deltaproteobacteria bacterium]|nr:MAG: hypothetical protein E6J91_40370 [Deltaproteobacteria bacterium]
MRDELEHGRPHPRWNAVGELVDEAADEAGIVLDPCAVEDRGERVRRVRHAQRQQRERSRALGQLGEDGVERGAIFIADDEHGSTVGIRCQPGDDRLLERAGTRWIARQSHDRLLELIDDQRLRSTRLPQRIALRGVRGREEAPRPLQLRQQPRAHERRLSRPRDAMNQGETRVRAEQ